MSPWPGQEGTFRMRPRALFAWKNLPKAKISERSRNYRHRTCPECWRSAYRLRTVVRRLHDLGDPVSGRPRDIQITYSQHHCLGCGGYFNADMEDLAPPKSHYTHRVIHTALRLVVEDGLPYREPTDGKAAQPTLF